MKISLKWLNEYLPLPYKVEEISAMLTEIGLEVEGIHQHEAIKGGLKGVVVGRVNTCRKHPDADRLSLTTVDIGSGTDLQIVCGAPNVAIGQKVAVATVGTKLYFSDGKELVIKKGKIRGVESEGMICAEDELGLGKDHSGIMVLRDDAEVGTPLAEYLNLATDTVFEIGLTPNRSDATCHLGVARDLYAYIKANKTGDIKLSFPASDIAQKSENTHDIRIKIENPEACKRYAGVVLSNIQLNKTPDWMKQYLEAIEVRSINVVVDITNFVLHEMGQPLHAFDYDKIKGKSILVKKLPAGTKFKALDEKEYRLLQDDLMICDEDNQPMCMGGVFGGIESGVSDQTTSIFLESAYFDAKHIRNSSIKHNLRTEAAKVFEKGADPNKVIAALNRAVSLMIQYAGARIVSDVVDIYPEKIQSHTVNLRFEKARDVIGYHINNEKILAILNALGMAVSDCTDDGVTVTVPTDKSDVTREIDIIEEIVRIYGLNNIPVSNQIKSAINYTKYPSKTLIKSAISQTLIANGFFEMQGLSLIESGYYKDSDTVSLEQLVYVNNTSNVHLDIMRPEMLISGLLSVAYNLNRQQTEVKLFEFGKAYLKKAKEKFAEPEYLSIFLAGRYSEESWLNKDGGTANFFHLKKMVLDCLAVAGIRGISEVVQNEDNRFAYALDIIYQGKVIAKLGKVKARINKLVGIKTDVYYAEVWVESLFRAGEHFTIYVEEPSKYPIIRRDLALVLDKSVQYAELIKTSKDIIRQNLIKTNLFDVYENATQLGEDKKSYAISFYFENKEKTFSDKEIDMMMERLIKAFEVNHGARIRS